MAKPIQQSPMTFRANAVESARIKADAKDAAKSVGTYIRDRLLAEPQTAPTYRPTETLQLMKHLVGHIGRVGSNLNQIAFKLNSNMMLVSVDRAQLEEGLRAIKDMRALLVAHLLHRGPSC